MKEKSPAFPAFIFKGIIITGCLVYSLQANAQSIVGKWKLTSAKEIVTDKATGKTYDLGSQIGDILKMMEEIIEFHADRTYFTSNKMAGDKKGFEGTGTYSVSGNEIKLQSGKNNLPETMNTGYSSDPMAKWPNTMNIISSTGNTLVIHYSTENTAARKNMKVDIEDTFTKQ